MRRVSAFGTLGLWLPLPALAAGEPHGPSFRGMGDGPGGDFLSKAYGVSADGRFVVGATGGEGFFGNATVMAFRWEDGALETLGWFAWLNNGGEQVMTVMSEGFAVSAGGNVVGRVCGEFLCAAARFDGFSPVPIQPDLHLIGVTTSSCLDGAATDITADGSAIYGYYWQLYIESLHEYTGIFRWQDSVTTVLAHDLDVYDWYWEAKVSSDGGAYAYSYKPFWDVSYYVVLHRLGEETFLDPGLVGDVSKLGLVVVGRSSSQAARWQGGGVTLLGDLPGGAEESSAKAVSDAGHVIAGWGTTDAGREAFLGTPETGMRRLADVLAEHGLDVNGWTLEEATGLSASGRTVVGWGTNPSGDTEVFVSTLPARGIPTPSLGRFGLALLVAVLIAGAAAAVRRGQGPRTSCAAR